MRIFTLALFSLFFLCRCARAPEESKAYVTQKESNAGMIRSPEPGKEIPPVAGKREPAKAPKHKFNPVPRPVAEGPAPLPDSTRMRLMNTLRMKNIQPDLNEPVSREALLNPTSSEPYSSLIELSRESFLKINFDNDILNNTDMYYTNGIRFDLIFPFVQSFPVSRLMIPYWGRAVNYYGFSLFQNMYTPSTTKVGGIHYGDRPYAAYLCVGLFKITLDPVHRFRQTSELDLGIIGQASFGEFVQKAYHDNTPTNNEPLGWEYQIRNDLVLNYNLLMEKGLIHEKHLELNAEAAAQLGTLYTNIEGGFHLRAGLMNPYFANLGVSKRDRTRELGLRNSQVFFFVKSSCRLVGYDATLEGGLFNHTSPYTMPASEISRFMWESSAGLSFVIYGVRLDAEQYFLSPEFHGGKWHFWVHAGLTFCL
ncbi:MAG TPA: lipid A deacylase LpxR family protein [Bacteroidales bacterium]|nr:lipid A deacylase LpxR family protein [Bacteroidales bacterium]